MAMTGIRAAANRSTSAVRTTIPGRARGGWNFDSASAKASLGGVPRSMRDGTGNASVTSGFIFRRVPPVNAA